MSSSQNHSNQPSAGTGYSNYNPYGDYEEFTAASDNPSYNRNSFPDDNHYENPHPHGDENEAIPHEIQQALDENLENLINQDLSDDHNDDDADAVLDSDEVQNAFRQFENPEYVLWDEMEECLRYMEDEYATAQMPEDLVESSQQSQLNPEAPEFLPPNFIPSAFGTNDNNMPVFVTSWTPCMTTTTIQEEQEIS